MDQEAKPQHKRRFRSGCIASVIGVSVLCVVLAGLSALSNQVLPDRLTTVDRLSALDKARISEALHLRRELGGSLWPGWEQADIPIILYNNQYAFLTGYRDPPAGWLKLPDLKPLGRAWEAVPGDQFDGQDYHRQRLTDANPTPQSFVVLIGDQLTASLTTQEWMEIGLGDQFKDQLPQFLQPLLPYRLASRLFLTSAGGKDLYILGISHEAFHAFAGIKDRARLMRAEQIYNENSDRYPADQPGFSQSWQAELNLLADAVQADSQAQTKELARQFLAQRQQRRLSAGLDDMLIELEKLKEWEEGLAKYSELMLWRQAGTDPAYQPTPAILNDPGFKSYAGYQQRWSQEIQQARRMADDAGDLRFYYSGLVQAAILDRLAPGWRARIFEEGVFLEDLLRQAVEQ